MGEVVVVLLGWEGDYSMHFAVADGPNHCPGCVPQAAAPCSTKLCIENGAAGSSAKSWMILRSSSLPAPIVVLQSVTKSIMLLLSRRWEQPASSQSQ